MKGIVKILLLLTISALYSIAGAQVQTTCKCGIPRDNTFQVAPMTVGHDTDIGVPPLYQNDNATTPAMALPFNFCFYGTNYTSVFISNNGIVSFVQPIHTFIDSTQHFPLGADTLMIAPFYADVNSNHDRGVVYYKITPTYMAVIWDSVEYAGTDVDGWNNFELIITNGTDEIVPDGNNVSFCYRIMQWACSEASGGFSGYNGTPAFIGVNKGDGVNYAQINTLSKPGNFYYGPFSTFNGVDWLDFKSFSFNTCVTGNVIAPVVINNVPDCNKLYICPCDTTATESALGAHDSLLTRPCDTVSMAAGFICPQAGQNAALSYSFSGALNVYSVYTSTANFVDSIMVQVIPAFGDTGMHTLTLTATDTIAHVQSSVTYTIDVTNQCLTAAVTEPDKNDFAIYPNPAEKNLTIKLDDDGGITTAKIYDILGTERFSGAITNSKTDIDISALARGMYFVQLLSNGRPVSIKKVILQ